MHALCAYMCFACLQEEVKSMTGSKFAREAYCADLQAKLATAVKEKGEVEVALRQVSEQLSEALAAHEAVQAQLRGVRERADAAEAAAEALKQQLAAAQREAEAHERRAAVSVCRDIHCAPASQPASAAALSLALPPPACHPVLPPAIILCSQMSSVFERLIFSAPALFVDCRR